MMKKNKISISIHKPLVLFLILLILATSGCNLKTSNGNLDSSTQGVLITDSVDVHFSIKLPTPLNSGETLALEILDEVTGIPYNSRLYPMQFTSELTYSLDLIVPEMSVIKYRYQRIGTAITPEVTANGDAVRYRLVYIHGETTVSDVFQGWQGTKAEIETGSLSGIVVEEATQQPLADILVSIGGNLTFTDANGQFRINEIAPGVQNIVFYGMDGHYETYQQGAAIVGGLNTKANVQLATQSLVQVNFRVTPPNDALGIPVYLAGNLIQLGNTFTDLNGGMSLKPKQMPMLTLQDDGSLWLTLDLYSGTDLRYKFTLGDGYWNAERTSTGEFNVRQLIVPDHSVTLDLAISSWRTPDFSPITFDITIPPETNPGDEKYIQLKSGSWTEPLPLWPLGSGKYIFILFSPFETSVPVTYRFCRNEDCTQALNAESLVNESSVLPADSDQSIELTLSTWQNWEPINQPAEVVAADIPVKGASYQTWVELSPEMTPAWHTYAPLGISTLSEIRANTVLLSPQWFISTENDSLSPVIGKTPFNSDLLSLMASINTMGMSTGLYPRVGPTEDIQTFWMSESHSDTWWQEWFTSYRLFILNYAQIAAQSQAEWLVIGGKDVMMAFPDGVFAEGSASDVPEDFDDQWLQLISQIRSIYSGQLVWAANAQASLDPLPHFIDMFDAVYVSIDGPIANTTDPTASDLYYSFLSIINSQVYEVYETVQKPVIVGLAYPSVDSASSGCMLIDLDCSNDGIFLPDEINGRAINLDEQVAIYNAAFPAAANQDWISGIAIRGYDPTVVLLDGSSSIAGKPALEVIWYWFSGLLPE